MGKELDLSYFPVLNENFKNFINTLSRLFISMVLMCAFRERDTQNAAGKLTYNKMVNQLILKCS